MSVFVQAISFVDDHGLTRTLEHCLPCCALRALEVSYANGWWIKTFKQ